VTGVVVVVVVVVVVTGGADAPTKSRRLGEPAPAAVTLLGVAAFSSPEVTVAGDAPLWSPRYSAALPTTWGVAIDVPLMVLVAVSLVFQSEVMPEPGANRSTQVPKFEYEARASVEVVAPTVIALGARAGDEVHASALLLPAATA
jgi:hypothetical protein